MSKPDDGGPIQGRLEQAFLIGPDGQMAENHNGEPIWHPVRKGGFTVRDGFAAAALIGLVGPMSPMKLAKLSVDSAAESIRALAMLSFAYADAMMAERKREAPE